MPLIRTFADICADAKTRIREISAEEVLERLGQPERDWVLIDVREQDEYRAGHMPGARGIGRGILEYHIADEVQDTDREIVLYCRGAMRSALSADSLRHMGYTNVLSMRGGWREWTEKGFPVSYEGEPIKH
jgi:rhodanese-related sulfurtransferase